MFLICLFVPLLVFILIRESLFTKSGSLLTRILSYIAAFTCINAITGLIIYMKGKTGSFDPYLYESLGYVREYFLLAMSLYVGETVIEFLIKKERIKELRDSAIYRKIKARFDYDRYEASEEEKHFRRICRRTNVCLILFIILVWLCYTLVWRQNSFQSADLNGMIFTLNMPTVGAQRTLYSSYMRIAAIPTLIWSMLAMIITASLKKCFKKNRIKRVYLNLKNEFGESKRKLISVLSFIFLAWFVVLLYETNSRLGISSYISSQLNQSVILEKEYVDPQSVELIFPENKRNLIYIYVESLESSLQDKASGGLFNENYIPELTQLAEENISFSQSDLIEGASVAPACGWTVAGMVAEGAGLPLKLFTNNENVDKSMGNYEYFLPGVTTIGDILEREGYINYFVCGSDLDFGGRTGLLTQHGNYQYFDYFTAIEEKKISEDYYVFWGYEDKKLYEFAKEKLLMLAEGDKPFNFNMLTVDTHSGGGYICDLCRQDYENKYANIFACASRQVTEFVSWIQQQDFYDNTTVIIVGDHCSMEGGFFSGYGYDKHNGETTRKVYNVIINSPVEPLKENYRMFTTLDLFPTTLAAIGVDIEGDRLGLGTNLFSDKETLAEQYGYEELFNDLSRASDFYSSTFLYPED